MTSKKKPISKRAPRSVGEALAQRTIAIHWAPEPEPSGDDWSETPKWAGQHSDLPRRDAQGTPVAEAIETTDSNLQRLIDAHPLIFRGQAPAVWSSVRTGWYDLIDKMCTDIEAALGPEGCADFEVRQIKSKFASLRLYYRLKGIGELHIDIASPTGRMHLVGTQASEDDGNSQKAARVRELVAAACATSETVCETCGAPAQLRDLGGYLTTLCDQHLAEALAESRHHS